MKYETLRETRICGHGDLGAGEEMSFFYPNPPWALLVCLKPVRRGGNTVLQHERDVYTYNICIIFKGNPQSVITFHYQVVNS